MGRVYHYVGNRAWIPREGCFPKRTQITHACDVQRWMREHLHEADIEGCITSTFILDLHAQLYVSHRRTEHVACARCQPVLAAGEITFLEDDAVCSIERVTNQSTGYCPDPSSWKALEPVLRAIGLSFPSYFTPAFDFRRCPKCLQLCMFKENEETCLVCDFPLPLSWNIDAFEPTLK